MDEHIGIKKKQRKTLNKMDEHIGRRQKKTTTKNRKDEHINRKKQGRSSSIGANLFSLGNKWMMKKENTEKESF